MGASDTHRAIQAVFRIEHARLIAGLARVTGDVGEAEELAQDAMVTALEKWPVTGVPDKPGAWLMAAGRNRALDRHRRKAMIRRKHEGQIVDIEGELTPGPAPDPDAALDDEVGDDLLSLIFTACHPVLTPEARIAMTLRLLGGLTTEEIARAFLIQESAVSQRIVRAKRTLSEAGVPFETPRGAERNARLGSVLGVIYLIFNEGYSATAGQDWIRPGLMEEALRLGRILAGLAPDEPEVHGLVALMEIQSSRIGARMDAAGEPILLLDQDRGKWNRLMIQRGLAGLARCEALGGAEGPYALQAAIAACHARAATAEATEWARIASLYGRLARIAPSPVVELNRAVAVAMADGPAAGLEVVDAVKDEPALKAYHLLPAVRADMLEKLGRLEEAKTEYLRGAVMARNARERDLLNARAARLGLR